MTETDWKYVNIHVKHFEIITKHIKKTDQSFRNESQFVQAAVRTKLEELGLV